MPESSPWDNPLIYIIPGTAILIALVTAIVKWIYWMGGMGTFKTTVESALGEIRTDIRRIFDLFSERGGAVTPNSPVGLTDLGRTISKETGARDWAEEKANAMIESLRGKSPYEIQEHCFQFAGDGSNYTPAMTSAVQANAYNHGLIVEQVRRVFGVELRDVVLRKLGLQAP